VATIHVDGKQYEVDGADNLLQACLGLGLDIPYFCWHPALGSVGACRQCAVKAYKDENDKMGRIVMSCMTPASNGTYISIADDEAKAFRETIVSFLMTNHPHDCPVCEEGGHCHLQDMTVMTGHHSRDYRFTKRTHLNQELGPFVAHEMNRCIACYRCVRYYRDYAGGTDLGVYGSAANVYFGRPASGTLESEFSGNLTEVCPTGVFTDKTHSARYTRKWDMQYAPSICTGCAVGCNVAPGERYGEIRRVENRYNGDVNGYFLCDRGRFGYGYTNAADRPRQPLVRQGGKLTVVSREMALAEVSAALASGKRVLGIGSPRATLEANHALRSLVGAERFFDGVAANEQALSQRVLEILRDGPIPAATVRELEEADAVLVLGEDLTSTAPRLALALRQSARGKMKTAGQQKNVPEWQVIALADLVQRDANPLFVASVEATRLDDAAAATYRAAPADLARLGYAVAHLIDASSPAVSGLDADTEALAKKIADALLAAQCPAVVSGFGAGSMAVLEAAANVAWALKTRNAATLLSLTLPEANSMGLALMAPKALDEALSICESGGADTLIVLENDLYRRASKARVDAALAKVPNLIVLDHSATSTVTKARIVLPSATVFEGDGTFVSQEGRAQRHFQVFDPTYYKKDGDKAIGTLESWRWLSLAHGTGWDQLDHATAACATAIPALAGIEDAAPGASFRINGAKLAREPHRYSGRTAMRADISVHEPRQPQDVDSALNFSMEGYNGVGVIDRPAELVSYAWAPGWNSPSAWNKFQDEIGGHMRGGDSGVRLLTPAGSFAYFGAVPAPAGTGDRFRVLALHRHFGCEELSSKAKPITERAGLAFVAINGADAQRLGLNGHAVVEVDGALLELPTLTSTEVPAGHIGLPAGFAGIPFLAAGMTASLRAGG